MTKEEAIRDELRFGRKEGLLPLTVAAVRGLKMNVKRLEAIADGALITNDELDVLWAALSLDESALEDEPDPEAPSERAGVRSWVLEMIDGVEGPCIALTPTKQDGGTRIAGSKPWGGGHIVRTWATKPESIFIGLGFKLDESKELAQRVEENRKGAEEKGWITKTGAPQ